MHNSTVSRPLAPLYKLFLFGRFRIERRDPQGHYHPLPPDIWDRQSPRRVLTYLLLAPGRHSLKDPLLDALCPDDELDRAQAVLSQALSLIRHVLVDEQGCPLLLPRKATPQKLLVLAGREQIWCDWDEFEDMLMQAQAAEQQGKEALPWWEQAYALCREEFLLEELYHDWCREVRERAEGDQRLCLLHLAACYQQQGRSVDAERILRAWLSAHALDQDVLCRLMEVLANQGRIQEALAWYQRTCEVLQGEGAEVTEHTRETVRLLQTRPSSHHHDKFGSISLPIQETRITQHSLTLPIWTDTDLISSLPLAAPIPSEQLLALGEPLYISKETLQLFSTLTETCRHLSEGNELRIAEQVLWAYLPKIEFLARLPSEHQEEAAAIASQGYLLAASLVGHRNDLLKRLRYSKQALHYGEVASDLNLQLVALRQTAISFDNMDHPDKVLEVSQQALPYLERVSPLLQACIYAGISGAYAELGQKQDALTFIELAYEHFPEHPDNEPRYLHTICRYSTLVFFDGLNRLDLGEPHEAEKILAQIDGLQPKLQLPERVRIELLNYQVKVFLALKEKEKASAYLEEAAKASFAIGSERHFQEAFALYRQMQKIWVRDPQVQQLADLFIR